MSTYDEQVKAWLDTPPQERDLNQGATLMLQGNRNRILHQNVIRRNNFDKIESELRKIQSSRSDNCQESTVKKMTDQVKTIVSNLSKTDQEKQGKREDHEQLPENIRVLYDRNLSIYPEMRATHERLKVLNQTGTSCDRYPFLKKLIKLEEELRENWEKYDSYVPGEDPEDTELPESKTIDAKRVSANRKYLSNNKSKLQQLIDDKNIEKADQLRVKMQERYKELIDNGETFDEKQIAELTGLGVISPN